MSTSKKTYEKAKRKGGADIDRNTKVPRLDLSKVKNDSDESSSDDDGDHKKSKENHVTYQ